MSEHVENSRAAEAFVVIAAYNEAAVIGEVVRRVRETFPAVVVVDDGSPDQTSERAGQAGALVVRHPINLGQGAALKTGIDFALKIGAETIVTFDADGQHLVEDAVRMVETLTTGGFDIVVGSRFLGESPNIPALRKAVLRMAVLTSNLFSKTKLTDAHNGLRAMTAETARRLHITQNRMAHASEITSQFATLGLRFAEIPVTISYTEYSLAKGQKISNALRICGEILAGIMVR